MNSEQKLPIGGRGRRWLSLILKTLLYVVTAVLLLLILLSLLMTGGVWLVAGHFLFGWIAYLRQVVPSVEFNLNSALHAAVALLLASYGLHRILSAWLKGRIAGVAGWRVRWTMTITAMILLLFATSIAATGIAHQVGWLLQTSRWVEYRYAHVNLRNSNNLRYIAEALALYSKDHPGKLPDDLSVLVPKYLMAHGYLFERPSMDDTPVRVLYFTGHTDEEPPDTVILAQAEPDQGQRAIARLNGTSEIVKEDVFQEILRAHANKRRQKESLR